jgi:hypothetical protein
MTRALYRFLLWLHPWEFQERFQEEMLWIFDEAAAQGRVLPLLADGLLSLARQWLLRPGTRYAAFVLLGASLEMAVIFVGPALFQPPDSSAVFPPASFRGHWSGNLRWPQPAGRLELTLTNESGEWAGELHIQGPHGELRVSPAEDIRVEGNTLRFRVRSADTDLTFKGTLVQGSRLAGTLRPSEKNDF